MRECTSLRHLICGGEALPPSLAQRFQQVLPHAHLHNLYGPTEATVACTGASDVLARCKLLPVVLPIVAGYELLGLTDSSRRPGRHLLSSRAGWQCPLGSRWQTAARTCWTPSCSWCRWVCRAS